METYEYKFDRIAFLEKLVGQFMTKKDKQLMERVYNQMLKELDKQINPYNQMETVEKKRILKEWYRSVKSDEFRAGLKGQNHRKIALDFADEMLGIPKRKYDMSDMFNPGLIASKKLSNGLNKKLVDVKILKEDDRRRIPYVTESEDYIIEEIGELVYIDGINLVDNLKQYSIIMPDGCGRKTERKIFTNEIDFNALETEKDYSEAFFNELLSFNNMDKSNAGGYIGELVHSNGLKPTEEKIDNGGFYTYGVNKYAISYDAMAVTAAKIIEEREKKKQDIER